MFDCFLQLRVVPPSDFPISDEKKKHREERLKAREERQRRWKEELQGEMPSTEECKLCKCDNQTCGCTMLYLPWQHRTTPRPVDVPRCVLCASMSQSWKQDNYSLSKNYSTHFMRANFAFTADKEGIRNDDHLSFAHGTYFIVFPSPGRAASGESASYLPFACGA